MDPLNQHKYTITWTDHNTTWSPPYDTGGWGKYNDWYWSYPAPGKAEVSKPFQDLIKICSTMEETEMAKEDRELQTYEMYRMVLIDNQERKVLYEGYVAARSVNSANIKFAELVKEHVEGFDVDLIGDRYDFHILGTHNLYKPADDIGVTKVKVVE